MPTYQYRCTACGQDLEAVQSFSDAALTECPSCDGRLRKVFGNVGVVFKGSGFYKTDSRSGGGVKTADKAPEKAAEKKEPASAPSGSSTPSSSSSDSGSSSSGSSSNGGSSSAGSSGSSSTGSSKGAGAAA